ncbi:MAG: hypothetical protein JJU21_17130 [Salinarimonas sp.]|nr:hypothetical protein [Salinarimonas sp.]
MDFPGIKSPQVQSLSGAGQVSAFSDAMMTKGAAPLGAPGAVPSAPTGTVGGDGVIDENRVARQIYTVCFGDADDHLGNAFQRTSEGLSTNSDIDGAIAAMRLRFRDELAEMQELHSPEELRDIARAGAKVVVEAVRRGDVIGFLHQFQANIFAGMNKTSQEILHDRGIAESGNFVGPERLFPVWGGGGPAMPEWGGGGGPGGWRPGDVTIGPMSSGGDVPSFDQLRREFEESRERISQRLAQGAGNGSPADDTGQTSRPGIISPAEMLRNARTEGQRNALEQAEKAAREAIERSLGNSSFVTGESPIQKAIEEHGPLVELFLHALWPQFTPGTLGGAPSSRPGISTATINALRNLDPRAAAGLVNDQLSDTIENVPPNYRDAILEALRKGDEQDPDIDRAIGRLEQLRKAEAPDAVDGPPVVTNVPDAIRLLQDRYGMYVAADLHNAGSDRTYHFEETFLEVVNNALPILDEIARRFPGALEGIGLALKTPNTRDAENSGFMTVGVSSEQTGVMALMAPSQIAKYEIMQDVDTVFRGTVAHEAMHAMVARADPMLVQRFRDNLEPIATVHGPNNDNPAPGSMSRQDIIDEMYFPGATWQEFLQWAKHEGYIIQPTTEGILDSLQELGYAPYFTPRYEGDVTIFRDPEEPACEVLGLCVSRYAGNPYEGLSEMFAANIMGTAEPDAFYRGLPHNTIGLDPSNPPPRNLREHLDDIMASVMHGQSPDSYHLPSPIRAEDYEVQE